MRNAARLAMFALSITSAAAAEKMYWIQFSVDSSSIVRADLNGNNVQLVNVGGGSGGMGGPISLAVDKSGGKIYFCMINNPGATINRADLDGSNAEILISISPDYARDMALDVSGGNVFWTDSDEIRSAGQDGSGMQVLVGGLSQPRGLSLDVANARMYWTEEGPPRLRRANLDGSAVEDLIVLTGIGRDTVLAPGPDKIYWIQSNTLHRADLDGTNPETLPTSLDGPGGIDFNPANWRIYLTDTDATQNPFQARILRTNVDGGEAVTLLSAAGAFGVIQLDTPLPGGGSVPASSYAGMAVLMLALLAAAAFVARARRGAMSGAAPPG